MPGLARHPFDAFSFVLGLLVTLVGLALVAAPGDLGGFSASWALPVGLVVVAGVLLVSTVRQATGRGPDAEAGPSDDTADGSDLHDTDGDGGFAPYGSSAAVDGDATPRTDTAFAGDVDDTLDGRSTTDTVELDPLDVEDR